MKTWVITGCRDYADEDHIKSVLNEKMKKEGKPDEFVHGGCCGVDNIGGKWAKENNIPVKVFKADWGKYGKSAGPIRNSEMANYCKSEDKESTCIAFWDNKSKGTKNMINTCSKLDISTEINTIRSKDGK